MKFIFVDRDPWVVGALQSVMPEHEARHCNLNDIPLDDYDILLTPGNSFGFMDGGFDLAVRNLFPEAEAQVQRNIKQFYYGQLAVGQAFAIHVGQGRHLVYAPTMRVPHPIVGTDNVYVAFRAALLAVRALVETRQTNASENLRILAPAFGTSAGQVTPSNAAHQIRLAIAHALRTPEEVEQNHTWHNAWKDHNEVIRFK